MGVLFAWSMISYVGSLIIITLGASKMYVESIIFGLAFGDTNGFPLGIYVGWNDDFIVGTDLGLTVVNIVKHSLEVEVDGVLWEDILFEGWVVSVDEYHK